MIKKEPFALYLGFSAFVVGAVIGYITIGPELIDFVRNNYEHSYMMSPFYNTVTEHPIISKGLVGFHTGLISTLVGLELGNVVDKILGLKK